MKLLAVLSIVLTATFHLKSVQGCSCQPTHPQIQFCRSDYVIKVKVIERETIYHDMIIPSTQRPPSTEAVPEVVLDPRINDPLYSPIRGPPGLSGRMIPASDMSNPNRAIKIVYTVYIEKIYKGDEFMTSKNTVKLATSPHDSICGVTTLELNKRYVLAGKVINGELSITICDFIKNFRDVTKRQKQGLKYHWRKQCGDCEVSVCFGQYCPNFAIPNVCMLDIAAMDYPCETDYARCAREINGDCIWLGKRDYRDCKKQRSRALLAVEPFLP